VTFNVSGVSGTPTNVEVSHTLTHSWVGDIRATLIAPNASSHILYSRTGGTTSAATGDSSNLLGTYNIKDSAVGTNWWAAAAAETTGTLPIPAGDYKSTTPGGMAGGGMDTNITPSFSSVTDSTGTWTLRLEDGCAGDTGAISAAVLTIDGGSPPVPGEANVDFNGDGTSDYVVARDLSPPPVIGNSSAFFKAESVRERLKIQAEQQQSAIDNGVPGTTIGWYIDYSGANPDQVSGFGVAATDFLVPNDYNVDGRDDIAIWRPGAPTVAAFYILNGGDFTVREEAFGQTGDDVAITGDYDGDGIADLASFRCPALGAGDGQCFFFYKGSDNNPGGNITYVPWGFGETFDFFVNPGDFDGDQKYDFCIQRTDPAAPGAGQFVLLRSSDGGIEYINWGRNTDIIVPGDYDGDGMNDFCVSRTETIDGVPGRSYYILERDGGGTGISPIRWGIAGDTRAPGDYDGDGATDIAIWRPNANPDMNFFYIRRSSDGALQTSEWGLQNDFAVASWLVH
jgi:subtilisin-like proprotein convertase family protein